MIITREQQEAIVNKYAKDHNTDELLGFVDGIVATIELVDRILKSQIKNN